MVVEVSVAAREGSALLLGWALTYLVHSTLLLGGLRLLTSRGIGSWPVREVLWKVAVVGGVLTATVQSVVARGPEPEARTVVVADRPEVEPSAHPASAPGAALTLPRAPWIHLRLEGDSPAPPPGSDGRLPIRWTVWLLAAWGAGAGIGLVALVGARIRLRSFLRARCAVTDPSLRAMLDDLRQRAGIGRTVRLTQMEGLQTPFATGTGEICLPLRVVRELDAEQQRSVLAHELAHLLRRDPWWFTGLALIERVLFFQPLNRVARREIQEGAELLCDDWAAEQVGGLALARSLAEVASWSVAPPQTFALARMAGAGPLTRRVERLLSRPARSCGGGHRAWVGVAGGLAVLAVACAPGVTVRPPGSEAVVDAPGGGAEAEAVADASAAAAPATETPERVVSVAADGTILYGSEGPEEGRTVEWAHGPFWQNVAEVEGRIRFESRGRIAFSADGTEVVGLSDGARFVVEEADTSGVRRLEVSPGAGDAVHYNYSVDGRPEPWRGVREQRRWLGPLVRELVRVSTPEAGPALQG